MEDNKPKRSSLYLVEEDLIRRAEVKELYKKLHGKNFYGPKMSDSLIYKNGLTFTLTKLREELNKRTNLKKKRDENIERLK